MQHLTASDRSQIQTLLDAKVSPLTIAYQLNRAHSTIVREIRKHRRRCQKRKFFYTAGIAEEEYQIELHESRKGIDASEAEIRLYDELIRSGGHKGQGSHHIMTAHPDVFLRCEKTIYNSGSFPFEQLYA